MERNREAPSYGMLGYPRIWSNGKFGIMCDPEMKLEIHFVAMDTYKPIYVNPPRRVQLSAPVVARGIMAYALKLCNGRWLISKDCYHQYYRQRVNHHYHLMKLRRYFCRHQSDRDAEQPFRNKDALLNEEGEFIQNSEALKDYLTHEEWDKLKSLADGYLEFLNTFV